MDEVNKVVVPVTEKMHYLKKNKHVNAMKKTRLLKVVSVYINAKATKHFIYSYACIYYACITSSLLHSMYIIYSTCVFYKFMYSLDFNDFTQFSFFTLLHVCNLFPSWSQHVLFFCSFYFFCFCSFDFICLFFPFSLLCAFDFYFLQH